MLYYKKVDMAHLGVYFNYVVSRLVHLACNATWVKPCISSVVTVGLVLLTCSLVLSATPHLLPNLPAQSIPFFLDCAFLYRFASAHLPIWT
mmetsp:Transcript_2662/g.4607  ORF Transcript_2662/g.4607 Transcript_2662/m.4607 type:complete len:91 (+) Transcript_2662:43-315(+)